MTLRDMKLQHQAAYSKAMDLSSEGKHAAAAEITADLSRHYPESAGLIGVTGLLYFEAGLHDEAIECFRRALAMKPRSELASRGLFHALWEKGKLKEARAELQRFVALTDFEEFQEMLENLEEFMEDDDGSIH